MEKNSRNRNTLKCVIVFMFLEKHAFLYFVAFVFIYQIQLHCRKI